MTEQKRHLRPGRRKRARNDHASSAEHYIYGVHAVAAALGNPKRSSHRLVATENALHRLQEQSVLLDLPVETATTRDISKVTGSEAVHQGLLLYCDPLMEPEPDWFNTPRLLIVLDQVTDPHNIGAILRSASAFSAEGLVMTARHSPAETAVLAKTASGALEHVPIYRVRNLSKTLDDLKELGVMVVGLDEEGDVSLDALELPPPCAIVLGAEGKGLRLKTASTCDRLAHLPVSGAIRSLNVSNAAALSLYIAARNTIADR